MQGELFLNKPQTLKLKKIITTIFSSVESERFWDIFIHFDKINQEALYERIRDFYEDEIHLQITWYIFKSEPVEYTTMSREILELFDGILFFVQEEDASSRVNQDFTSLFKLSPLDCAK